jgi:hypothetical protein
MLRDADLARLAEHLQSHPLSLAKTRKLKAQLNAAAKHMQMFQDISRDRGIIQQMTKLIHRFEDDESGHFHYTLPASHLVCHQITYIMSICLNLAREQALGREQAWAVENLNLVVYKRVVAWWLHLLPAALSDHFVECTTYDSKEATAHKLFVQARQHDGLNPDADGKYWACVASWPPLML